MGSNPNIQGELISSVGHAPVAYQVIHLQGCYNLRVFYHAKIILKPERAKEPAKTAFEPDLGRDHLVEKIAVPFVQNRQFFCGGVVIQPSRVEEVKFTETEENAKNVLSKLRARLIAGGVISFVEPSDVVSEGRDITREILEGASASKLPAQDTIVQSGNVVAKKSDRVFVVHGHDHTAVDQTELLLHRFGLKPIILRDAPSAGRTVIEKFEAHANVGAAIVLLTPDDVGGVDAAHLAPRARQNVIWEWGYLVCRLGRPNVICVYKGGVEIPSDLHGIVTIHVTDDVREKAEEIRRELRAAGYTIV